MQGTYCGGAHPDHVTPGAGGFQCHCVVIMDKVPSTTTYLCFVCKADLTQPIPANRNFELLNLKREDIEIDASSKVDELFVWYLRGEEASFTREDLDTHFEVHIRNHKGWQKKVDKQGT